MPYTEPPALGGTTLARKWKLQVDTSAAQDGSVWTPVRGITDSTPTGAPGLQADSDYDSQGGTSSTATTQEFGFTATFRRATPRNTPTQYDPGQEFLRLMSDKTGAENSAHVRWFEWNGPNGPKVEAYEGYVVVAYSNNGGGPDALSTAGVTLTGQGFKVPITHPDAAGAPAPTVASLSPTTSALVGGALIALIGTQLNTVTTVTVGGTVVPPADWDSWGSTGISFKTPAKAAGTYDVVVTNPGGSSGTSANTKITYA